MVSDPEVNLGELGTMRIVQSVNVMLIFLISGFRLKTDAMKQALRHPLALLLGWFVVLVWTPLLGFAVARLPLGPPEFAVGLTLFCCVPTTLTSGAALVAGCRGSSRAAELALMITVSTNLLGCFTTPVWLKVTLGGVDAEIDVVNLLVKLASTILLPTLLGKALQLSSSKAAQFAKDRKTELTVLANFSLGFIIWQSVSRAQATIVEAGWSNIVVCIGSGIALHLLLWLVNAPVHACWTVRDVHQRRAVFLLGSQKTLPVSLAIIAGLPEGTVGNLGLVTLPCIFGHLSQLAMDAFLVDHWGKMVEAAGSDASKPRVPAEQIGVPVKAGEKVEGNSLAQVC
jgi:sodium/bile acid cotransporter 7